MTSCINVLRKYRTAGLEQAPVLRFTITPRPVHDNLCHVDVLEEGRDRQRMQQWQVLVNLVVLSGLKAKSIITPRAAEPRMYGLPKTHKPDIPVRPSVSMTRSAYEPL